MESGVSCVGVSRSNAPSDGVVVRVDETGLAMQCTFNRALAERTGRGASRSCKWKSPNCYKTQGPKNFHFHLGIYLKIDVQQSLRQLQLQLEEPKML